MTETATWGITIRQARIKMGWSGKVAAALYGQYVTGQATTEEAIYMIEKGHVPKSPKRRLVLAALLNIPPALLGISPLEQTPDLAFASSILVVPRKQVNLAEYQKKLQSYWEQGYEAAPALAMKDVVKRIAVLHDHVPYVGAAQRKQMLSILCSYQMLGGRILEASKDIEGAKAYLKRAIILAKEHGYSDLHATALYRRGVLSFHKWEIPAALRDLTAAHTIVTRGDIPFLPSLAARIHALNGETLARQAADQHDMTAALRQLDRAEKCLSMQPQDETEHYNTLATGFDPERYALDRAGTLMGAPIKRLRTPNEALTQLDEARKHAQPALTNIHGYRDAYSNVIEARIYLDKGLYPMATTQLIQGMTTMRALGSDVHTADFAQICASLTDSSYGASTEVAEARVELMKLQYGTLFA